MKLFFDSILLTTVGVVIAVATNDAVTMVVGAEIVDITTSNPIIVDLSKDFEKSNSYNDSPGMDMLNKLATAESNTQIVTVIQNGKIVGEYVRANEDEDRPNQLGPIYSVTKAVSGMLFGILVDQYGTSINTTLGEFFPNETDWIGVDDESTVDGEPAVDYMKSLTAYEILTMTTGLGTDPCYYSLNCTESWGGTDLQSVLAWPKLTVERGVFEYTHSWEILSYIITEVTGGLSPRELFAAEILPFLGINDTDIEWYLERNNAFDTGAQQVNTLGNVPTAWGLQLTTNQMAKIGQLVLQKGLAAPDTEEEEGETGTQVLPTDWIEQSLTPRFPIPTGSEMNRGLEGYTYGQQQWMEGPDSEHSKEFGIAYVSEGFGGQTIVVHPQSGIVLAVQSDDPFDPTTPRSPNLLWYLPIFKEGPDFFVSTSTTNNNSTSKTNDSTSSSVPPPSSDEKEDSKDEEAGSYSDSDSSSSSGGIIITPQLISNSGSSFVACIMVATITMLWY